MVWLLASNSAFAQDSIPDSLNIFIIKNYKPRLGNYNKINVSPEPIPFQESKPDLNYGVLSKQYKTSFDPEGISPAKMQAEPVKKLGFGYIKLGFGNYTTPFGEVSLANKRSKKYAYGLNIRHLSSSGQLKNTWFSGFSDNHAEMWGNYFVDKLILSGSITYDRNVVRYYGFDPGTIERNRNDFKNIMNGLLSKVSLEQGKFQTKSLFKSSTLSHRYFSSAQNVNENQLLSEVVLGYTLNSNNNEQERSPAVHESSVINMKANLDYFHINNVSNNNHSNVIATLTPSFEYKENLLKLKAGGSLVWDIQNGQAVSFIYPDFQGKISIVDELLGITAGVKGGLTRNSLWSVTNTNPFFVPFSATEPFNLWRNTSTTYDVHGGLEGKLSSSLTFRLLLRGSRHRNLPLFVNDYSIGVDGTRFIVVFDHVSLLNPHAEASWCLRDKFNLHFTFDYLNYNTDTETKAWHRPSILSTLSTNYNIASKFILKADIFYIGNQYARVINNVSSEAVAAVRKLKGITDLNLGLEYRFNKKFGAWLSANNIAGMRYQRWNRYPTQRFNFLVGISADF